MVIKKMPQKFTFTKDLRKKYIDYFECQQMSAPQSWIISAGKRLYPGKLLDGEEFKLLEEGLEGIKKDRPDLACYVDKMILGICGLINKEIKLEEVKPEQPKEQ